MVYTAVLQPGSGQAIPLNGNLAGTGGVIVSRSDI